MFEDKKNLARITELEEQLQARSADNDSLLSQITDAKVIVENLQSTNAEQAEQFQADLKAVESAGSAEIEAIKLGCELQIANLKEGVQSTVTTQVATKLSELGQPALDLSSDTDTDTHLSFIERYNNILDPAEKNTFYRDNRKSIWNESRKN